MARPSTAIYRLWWLLHVPLWRSAVGARIRAHEPATVEHGATSAERGLQGAAGAPLNATEAAAPGGELAPSDDAAAPLHRRVAGAEGSVAAELSQSQEQELPIFPVVTAGAAFALALNKYGWRGPFLPQFDVEATAPPLPPPPMAMPEGPLVDVLQTFGKVLPEETPKEFLKWNKLVSDLTFLKRHPTGDIYTAKMHGRDGAPLIVKTTPLYSPYVVFLSGREETTMNESQGDHVQILHTSFKAKVPAFDDDRPARIQVRFMVMEQGGGSFRDKILPFVNFIPLENKYSMMLDLLRGLSQVSRRGVVHRNINPDSVIVNKRTEAEFDYSLEIGDFSLAKEEAPRLDPWKASLGPYVGGSPIYMAPEIWHGKPPQRSSDLFSVGLMLYELFVGRLPLPIMEASRLALPDMKLDDDHPVKAFFDIDQTHYSWRSDTGLQELAWQSPGLAAFIASLLRYDPEERPAMHRAIFVAEHLEKDFRDHVLEQLPF